MGLRNSQTCRVTFEDLLRTSQYQSTDVSRRKNDDFKKFGMIIDTMRAIAADIKSPKHVDRSKLDFLNEFELKGFSRKTKGHYSYVKRELNKE
jgi:hypothetical protein